MIRSVRPSYRHVFVVVAVVASLYFAVRTSSAVVVDRVLASQLQVAQGSVDTIAHQNAMLSAQLAYQQTPAYAEQVARQQLGMMKPGDHVVHVQIAPAPPGMVTPAAPTPGAAAPAVKKASTPNWKRWLSLVANPTQFGAGPPLPTKP